MLLHARFSGPHPIDLREPGGRVAPGRVTNGRFFAQGLHASKKATSAYPDAAKYRSRYGRDPRIPNASDYRLRGRVCRGRARDDVCERLGMNTRPNSIAFRPAAARSLERFDFRA